MNAETKEQMRYNALECLLTEYDIQAKKRESAEIKKHILADLMEWVKPRIELAETEGQASALVDALTDIVDALHDA